MITTRQFGQLFDGSMVYLYTIKNSQGNNITITNFGGRIVSLNVYDRNKIKRDIVLGYDNLEQYIKDNIFLGGIIGRYAGRLSNSCYTLDNKKYKVNSTSNISALHGGVIGFDKVLWQAETSNIDNNSILLKYCSPHNQEGFVGNLNISVQYKWDDCNQLTMNITAVSDQDTICNITNHAYFNLDGHNSGHLNNHTIQIKSTKILDIDKNNLPTGNFISVKNTDLDLNQPKQLDNLNLPHRLIQQCSGYDFSYCLNNNDFTKSIQPKHIATAQSMTSGISLQLYTTKPTVQFYTGNSIQQNTKGKSGINYEKYSAFCLEPQFCPDAPNHKNLGDTILRVGKEYSHCNIYKIGIT